MFSDEKLCKLKDTFLQYSQDDIICDVARDRMKFFIWELKFLDIFLSLQSFTFAGECGLPDVTHKMQDIWNKLYVALFDSGYGNAYKDEYIITPLKDEFIDPNTYPFPFHVPTEILKTKLEFTAKYSFHKISIPPSAKVDDIPSLKFFKELIHVVAQNLNVLVQINDPSSLLFVPGSKKQIEDLAKELKLLRFFVCFASVKCIEHQLQHSFFIHSLTVTIQAAMVTWLCLSIHGKENQDLAPEMNVSFSHLLQMKTQAIKRGIQEIYLDILQALKSTIEPAWRPNIQNNQGADSAFVKTPAHNLSQIPTVSNPSEIVSLNDQMEILEEMLSILRDTLINLPLLDLELCFQGMDAVIVDAGLLLYSLSDIKGKEKDMALEDVNQSFSLDLPSNIHPIKAMIYLIIRNAVQSNLPKIHGLGYVDFLLRNLKEFQGRYSGSLAPIRNQLQIIQKEFESLQPFLKAVAEEQHNDLDKIHSCATLIIGKTYEVEYIVDACISKEVPDWCLELWLLDIMQEITLIRLEVPKIQEKKMAKDTVSTGTTHTSSKSGSTLRRDEEIVGFEEVIEKLRDQLIKGTRGRDVLSIVGMPGLGKTTLAYRLYSDRSVVSHFDIRAQCCVSQVFSRQDLLLAILRDAIGHEDKDRQIADDKLADKLRKTLLPKRYLILVDDVWEASVWDDLKGCFQDANNGSRIILTTRNHEVAKYARFKSDPFPLRMFNDDESWKLLRQKVFGEESYCPPHLSNIGYQIAKKCGQLPLSVALVAGILAEMEKKEECWEQLANNLGPHIHKDSREIIEKSYHNLPYHLRSCFLYFGAFLEDSVINMSKLIRLWISEGFVKSCEGKSLEDIAEGYLRNLIGRNLVIETRRSSGGKIKACRVHDLLHDFCKERAKEENFLLWMQREKNGNSSSGINPHKQLAHRMSIYREGYHVRSWNSSWSLVGSIFLRDKCIAIDQVSHILHNFKFLKVLDLRVINIHSLPTELIYLRYFSAQFSESSIPSSIASLWNLETLTLRNYNCSMSLPITFWEMVNLRHLKSCFLIKDAGELLDQNSATLYDLETLSTLYFSCVEDVELILRKAPNLRKLKCRLEFCKKFQYRVLSFPTQLETLNISTLRDYPAIPFCISIPSLKNLTLCNFYLDPQQATEIALLQNLLVLKLECIKFDNEEWKVCSDEFPQLKVLKLYNVFAVKKWTVAEGAFPNIERLVLHNCIYFKEIPSCFSEISSLKYIEVRECEKSVAKSARDIQETQVEVYQHSGFEVVLREMEDSDSDGDDDDGGGDGDGDDDSDDDSDDDDDDDDDDE